MNKIPFLAGLCALSVLAFISIEMPAQAQSVNSVSGELANAKTELNRYEQVLLQKSLELKLLSTRVAEAEQLKTAIEQQHADAIAQQDAMGVSASSFEEILRLLQTQKVELTIELAGLNARRTALEDANRKSDAVGQGNSNPIIKQLEMLLELQKQKVDRAHKMVEKQVMSQEEVREAEKELLELELRLAEARTATRRTNEFDQQLMETSLQLVEMTARLEVVQSLLQQQIGARKSILSFSKAEREMDVQQNILFDLRQQIEARQTEKNRIEMSRAELQAFIKQIENHQKDQ